MNTKLNHAMLLAVGLLASPLIHAADDPAKDTITVVAENATPDDVTKTITLPASASEKAVEQSKKGLDTANAARELGREFGQTTAEQARADNPSTDLPAAASAAREAAIAAREAASTARSDNATDHRPATPGKP